MSGRIDPPLSVAPAGAPVPAAVWVGITLAGTTLWALAPPGSSFYWVCPIHQYTGLLCPGCGGTRAVEALLRGDLSAALHSNALVVMLLPLAAAWGVAARTRSLAGEGWGWPDVPRAWLPAMFGLVALFTLARNMV